MSDHRIEVNYGVKVHDWRPLYKVTITRDGEEPKVSWFHTLAVSPIFVPLGAILGAVAGVAVMRVIVAIIGWLA